MQREQIEDAVRQIVVDQMGVTKAEVVDETRLQEDLDADSLDYIELVMEVEVEFGIVIPESDGTEWVTFKDVIDYVEKEWVTFKDVIDYVEKRN